MMKRAGLPAALLLSFLCVALAAIAWPPLTGRVNDGANILSQAARSALESKLADLESRSSIQLVVATVPSLQDNDIETFSNGLFREWKLGEAKRNNGVLLVVAPNERKVRIEVGYGMEGTITDALSSVIIASAIVPKFKTGDFSGGVTSGVDALIEAMTNDQSEWQRKVRVRHDEREGPLAFLAPFIFFALFFFIVFLMRRYARGPGRWVRRGNQSIFIPGPVGGGWNSPSSWSGGSGGSWSSGGGGGGFDGGGFSGGGGSSGGGGASGSW